MNPDYRQIAELFGLAVPEAPINPDEAEEIAGESNDSAMELGEQALRQGEWESAVRHFLHALEAGEGDKSRNLLGLAAAYDCLEESEKAEEWYAGAVLADRSNPEAYLGLSDVYRRHGRQSDAIQQLERAIRSEPGNAFLHHRLASALRNMGYREKALKSAEIACMLDPESSFYFYWRGDLLIDLGRFPEAVTAFRAAAELAPGDDGILAGAALAFWGAGKTVEAIKAIRLASDLDPDKLSYYGLLEWFLRQSGQTREADLEKPRVGKMSRYDQDLLDRMLSRIAASAAP